MIVRPPRVFTADRLRERRVDEHPARGGVEEEPDRLGPVHAHLDERIAAERLERDDGFHLQPL
ncbi:MAG TPA: hypothetical protein VHI98_27280 [Vicinamibacterales bacterium]|jgi:hypothetical protein|nr:hypothetical protein [Vicinamibacterales bacterium]